MPQFLKCLRCNLPTNFHTRAMQLVSQKDVLPIAGFKMNLYRCIDHGGPQLPRQTGQVQQGEGPGSSGQMH